MRMSLKNAGSIKIQHSTDLWEIMQRLLKHENKVDPGKEHLWAIALDSAAVILNIELVTIGTHARTSINPTALLSIPLQKDAVSLVLVHNHPSGSLVPSKADQKFTNRLIQICSLLEISLADHMIISEEGFYSFRDAGLMDILAASKEYVPPYLLQETGLSEERARLAKELKQEIAQQMLEKGLSVEEVQQYTGLSTEDIKA